MIDRLRFQHGGNTLEDSMRAVVGQLEPTETVQLPTDVLFDAVLGRMDAARVKVRSRTIGNAVMD